MWQGLLDLRKVFFILRFVYTVTQYDSTVENELVKIIVFQIEMLQSLRKTNFNKIQF